MDSEDLIFAALFVIVNALVIISIVVLRARQSMRDKEADKGWKTVARGLGLQYRTSPARTLEGEYEGIGVSAKIMVYFGAQGDTYETKYRVTYPTLHLGLQITREGWFSSLSKAVGAQDIEVGDARFDDEFLVKGADPEAVRQFFTPARRMRVERLFSALQGSCRIEDTKITYIHNKMDTDAEAVTSTIHMLVRTARHLVEERDDDACLDRAIASQEDGDLAAALARLREVTTEVEIEAGAPGSPGLSPFAAVAAAPPPPRVGASSSAGAPSDFPVEELVMEGELLYLAEDFAGAARVFERAHFIAPFDEEILGWHKLVRQRLLEQRASDGTSTTKAKVAASGGTIAAGAGVLAEEEISPNAGVVADEADARRGQDGGGQAPALQDARASTGKSRTPPDFTVPPGVEVPYDSGASLDQEIAGDPAAPADQKTIFAGPPAGAGVDTANAAAASGSKAPTTRCLWVDETEDERGMEAAIFCEELFKRNRSSLEIRREFEERYKGRTVRWEGVLRRLDAYTFDLVFGREPGTKAVVDVHELESIPFGDQTVRAIVQLPAGADKALEHSNGEHIRFEGRLLQADGLMRNLYVGSASVV